MSSKNTKKPRRSPPKKKTTPTKEQPVLGIDSRYALQPLSTPILEQTIAKILLHRYHQDIARMFSTHIHNVALKHLPKLITSCLVVTPPGWIAHNANSDTFKEFFRGVLAMDLRQAGERVATQSVLWSYTALRHFAVSHDVPICKIRGVHSTLLLPYLSELQAQLEELDNLPPPTFSKPPHLSALQSGLKKLEKHCVSREKNTPVGRMPESWHDWRTKVRVGYEMLVETLWETAREFDVRGYGHVLRDKLNRWCDCGCSSDHLGEVCEKTVREDEEEAGKRPGKERPWDGRGGGILGWETEHEEDLWVGKLDFGSHERDKKSNDPVEEGMTVGDMMEWRYLKAEREKERGNMRFRAAKYEEAVKHYTAAHEIEPELPHYQLNIAAAQLKLERWLEAEAACDIALGQHRSHKGLWRRAKARKMLDKREGAIEDLEELLTLHPNNPEAISELEALCPPSRERVVTPSSGGASTSAPTSPVKQPRKAKTIPFELSDSDQIKLKVLGISLTLQMPDSYSGAETFTYPSWERYRVEKGT